MWLILRQKSQKPRSLIYHQLGLCQRGGCLTPPPPRTRKFFSQIFLNFCFFMYFFYTILEDFFYIFVCQPQLVRLIYQGNHHQQEEKSGLGEKKSICYNLGSEKIATALFFSRALKPKNPLIRQDEETAYTFGN